MPVTFETEQKTSPLQNIKRQCCEIVLGKESTHLSWLGGSWNRQDGWS